MKRIWYGIALAILCGLGGCASAPGQYNGLGSDPMSMLVVYRVDDRPLTMEALKAVRGEAEKMMARIGIQLSSPLEAGLTDGVLDIVGSAADPGMTVKVLRPHGIVGFIGGLAMYSYAMVSAIADATRDRLEFLGETDDGFKRLRVAAAFVRSDPTKGIEPTPTRR